MLEMWGFFQEIKTLEIIHETYKEDRCKLLAITQMLASFWLYCLYANK